MRINLSEKNMDLVMHTVRKRGLKIENAIDFLLNNPEEIMSTRGVLDEQKTGKKAFKKIQK